MNRRGAKDERAKRIAATEQHFGMTPAEHDAALLQVTEELGTYAKKASVLDDFVRMLGDKVDGVSDGSAGRIRGS